MKEFQCRKGCGACCIAPSFSFATPGFPNGKPAGVPCSHLTDDFRCSIYTHSERPDVCASFQALPEHCGSTREEALLLLARLEALTRGE
ncbi:MAG: YkgJ family cysteine cluster protein [Nitrospiraceae bacterium]|jgi:Fe-S-cluster containining protein|nr:YkgJ family cysteine cluster protein [Nitrospiraceae bacterium]